MADIRLPAALLGLIVATLPATRGVCEPFRLTDLAGKVQTAEIESIDSAGKMQVAGDAADVELEWLRRIERVGELPETAKPAVVVELHGGKLLASGITLADEKCRIEWSLGKPLDVPIDAVRAIRFRPQDANELFAAALAKPSAENDLLFVQVEGGLQSIGGLVEQVTAESVVFEREAQRRTLPRSRLFGIVVAQFNDAARPPAQSQIALAGGSRVSGEIVSFKDNRLEIRLPGDAATLLPWSAVTAIDFRSRRLTLLSDLDPIEVDEQTLVTPARAWRRDRSVAGKPLTLNLFESGRKTGERRYSKGIGVHSRSRLTFATQQKYDTLAAVIGIDADANRHGDCLFVVLADGREIYRQRVRGSDPPRDVRLDIASALRVTLLVEPGEALDLADHADWCDARLLNLAP